MDQKTLQAALRNLPLGGLRFFPSIGSTNDEALAWAAQGARNLSIVVADEQTQGRGRLDRKWSTPKGTALAFSVILLPTASLRPYLSRTVGLAALSITDSLLKRRLEASIKWPNDILLNGHKLAGILIESVWAGDEIDSLVIGIGLNVKRDSTPPAETLNFPATSIEDHLDRAPAREELLRDILAAFLARLPQVSEDGLIKAWEEKLSFRGEQVEVRESAGKLVAGELLGLEADGSLQLRDKHGNPVTVRFGDVSLRPST